MTEAIFGLVGVVVGGLMTGGLTFMVERNRERQVARIAARIMREHLLDVMRAGEDSVEGRPAALPDAVGRLLAAWTEERRALAAVMDYKPYADLVASVRAAANAEAAQDRDELIRAVGLVGGAAHELKPLAGAASA